MFIHGLTGKRSKTWTAPGATEPWPKTLLQPSMPEARLITFGYDADVLKFAKPAGQNTVRDNGKNLMDDLTGLRYKTKTLTRPMIFVVHSLGGLVIKSVRKFQYLFASTH